MATYETREIEVCTDCILMVANGETTFETAEEEAAHVERMSAQWPPSEGWHLWKPPRRRSAQSRSYATHDLDTDSTNQHQLRRIQT